MDDVVTKPKARVTAAEMERRRKIVRQADANNRIEGVYRRPATDAIVDMFIRGEIDVMEMSARIGALPQPR